MTKQHAPKFAWTKQSIDKQRNRYQNENRKKPREIQAERQSHKAGVSKTTRQPQMRGSKSFLVLFSKKDCLPCLAPQASASFSREARTFTTRRPSISNTSNSHPPNTIRSPPCGTRRSKASTSPANV